jgi:ribonuclease HI
LHSSDHAPFPPWYDISELFVDFFIDTTVENINSLQANQIYKNLIKTKYAGYHFVFTDGSKIINPEISVSSALAIPSLGIKNSWKLSADFTVLHAELYAIYQALLLIKESKAITSLNVVIFTDSLSSIYLLLNRFPTHYMYITYSIQKIIFELNKALIVKIQFIPGHKDIAGNEEADQGAKDAHNNNIISEAHLSKEEMVRIVRESISCFWGQYYVNQVEISGKGRHLFELKDSLVYWPWTSHRVRVVETAMARLRLGHVGLNEHLFRFKMRDTNLCECGELETIAHFLMHCPNYNVSRGRLRNQLMKLNVNFNLKNILGGGVYSPDIQKNIVDCAGEYLLSTGRLWDL